MEFIKLKSDYGDMKIICPIKTRNKYIAYLQAAKAAKTQYPAAIIPQYKNARVWIDTILQLKQDKIHARAVIL